MCSSASVVQGRADRVLLIGVAGPERTVRPRLPHILRYKSIAWAIDAGPGANRRRGAARGERMNPIWLPASLFGGLFQAWRTALQQRLRAELSVSGAGLVRYLYGLPFALCFAAVWLTMRGDAEIGRAHV